MQRSLLIGFLLGSLAACDSGGDDGEDTNTDGSTSMNPGTTANDSSETPSTGTTSTGTTSTSSEPGTDSSSTTSTGESETEGETTTGADESTSTGEVAFALTSPAFEEGGLFPGSMHISGGNEHPQLDWEGAPAETQSFGVFFHDVTISFEHSAVWNVPADVSQLPEGLSNVPMPEEVPGAVQCRNWTTQQFGYGGPGSDSNFYQFTLYALDVADLSGEIDQDSSLQAVQAAFEAHSIETATLSGQTQGP